MMSKWQFRPTEQTTRRACTGAVMIVAVALLAATGCGGDLAASPTGVDIDDIINQQGAFSMSGRVFDGDTDEPIEGARVTAGAASVRTDADGAYRIEGLGGIVMIRASAAGYRATESLPMRFDDDQELDFSMAVDGDGDERSEPVHLQ